MSKPLLKYNIRSFWVLITLVCAILTMYICVIIGMYDPDFETKMSAMLSMVPPQMLAAFGMQGNDGSLLSFMNTYLYGLLFLLLPLIFICVAANRLVAKEINSGAMAYLLATPNSRTKIIRTQIVTLFSGVFVILFYITILILIVAQITFQGKLNLLPFLRINTGLLGLQFAVSGIALFASCISNDSHNSLMLGTGIPIVFYVIHMLGNMADQMDGMKFFKYITIYSLFDAEGLKNNEATAMMGMFVLFLIGIILYAASKWQFVRRDLPL